MILLLSLLLLSDPIVPTSITVNTFTEASAKEFAESLKTIQRSGQSVIPVFIDSPGGSVYSLLAMCDLVKSSKVPVATIIVGKAMSAGAIFFSCGTNGYRYASPNSTIMIHEVSSNSSGKVEELKIDTREADRLNILILKILANNIGKEDDYFLKVIHEHNHLDWYLTPEEAKTLNLVNHIKIPDIKLKVELE